MSAIIEFFKWVSNGASAWGGAKTIAFGLGVLLSMLLTFIGTRAVSNTGCWLRMRRQRIELNWECRQRCECPGLFGSQERPLTSWEEAVAGIYGISIDSLYHAETVPEFFPSPAEIEPVPEPAITPADRQDIEAAKAVPNPFGWADPKTGSPSRRGNDGCN